MSLLIKCDWVIPSWDSDPIKGGAVVVEGERIVEVGRAEDLRGGWDEVLELKGALMFPALFNAHTHASMTIFRGLADDLPLMTWLKDYIFPAESRLKPHWVYWGAKLAVAEMIRSAVAGFCDMYIFEEEVIKVVEETGVKAALGEGLFDFPSPGYGPLENGLKLTEELLKNYETHSRVNVLVSPHAVYTCSGETLKKAKAISEKFGARIHIHLSETKDEVNECLKRYGKRPVEHLKALGLLDESLHIAHGVELTDSEIEELAKRGVSVAHCPESNLKLGSGVARLPEMLRAGVRVCLGTDGPASNNDLDLISEMRTAALLQKGLKRDPTVVKAKEVFRMATEEGARALGFSDSGRIEPGFRADLAVLKLSDPWTVPVHEPLSLLVYSARAGSVSHLMVDGRWIMKDGRILSFDEEETREEVRRVAEEIKGGG